MGLVVVEIAYPTDACNDRALCITGRERGLSMTTKEKSCCDLIYQ